MVRRVRRNLLLGVGLALGAAVLALGRDDDRVAPDLGRRDVAAHAAVSPLALVPPLAVAPAAANAPPPTTGPAAAALSAAGLSAAGEMAAGEMAAGEMAAGAMAPLPPPRPIGGAAADRTPELDLARMELRGDRYLAPMRDGRWAILTLDPKIQAVAEKVLRRAKAPRGAIVVTHPDGRILALAGRRTDDPTGAGEGIADPRLALDAWAPSASIFKVVTAAALVEAGVRKSDRVCFHGGVRSVMESNLTASRLDRRCEDLSYGVAHSQNAIIAKLTHQKLTPGQLTEVARRLGFDRPLPAPLDGEVGELTAMPADKGVDFARTAAGFQGVTLSAVGGAMLANTVAAGGMAMTPQLVSGYLDGAQELPAAPTPAGQRVLEESVADEVGTMMAATCADGSAAKAFAGRERIPGVAVAGKTGTLSDDDPFYMQYSWFVGYAPVDKPQLSVSVLLGNPELWQLKAHTAARMVLIEALRSRAGS
jgi:peptidoglycan glycosyltransferase